MNSRAPLRSEGSSCTEANCRSAPEPVPCAPITVESGWSRSRGYGGFRVSVRQKFPHQKICGGRPIGIQAAEATEKIFSLPKRLKRLDFSRTEKRASSDTLDSRQAEKLLLKFTIRVEQDGESMESILKISPSSRTIRISSFSCTRFPRFAVRG